MGHARPSNGDTRPPAEGADDPTAAVDDFTSFWRELNRQAKAQNVSAAKWVACASRVAGRQQQTSSPEHQPFPVQTLYDRVQKGRRVGWEEARHFVRAIPGMDEQRWKTAWERADRAWRTTPGTPSIARNIDPQAALAPVPAQRTAKPDDTEAQDVLSPPRVAGWRRHIVITAGFVVLVLVLAGALLMRPIFLGSPGSANTAGAASSALTPTQPTPAITTESPSRQVGTRHEVCAESLSVRRDPQPKAETEVLASLQWGDTFYVELTRGPTWSYGVSDGSVEVRGWVETKWLMPTC